MACLLLAALLATTANVLAAEAQWRLQIDGHQRFVFGEAGFGGGVQLSWEVTIDFLVEDGEFRVGSGRARWHGDVLPLSAPADWFDCRSVEGTYLDSNLALHHTPRVRFAAFPVAGRVADGRVELQPGYEPPGNYLAVTFECVSRFPATDNWFEVAERGKQVLGKRQDAERRTGSALPAVRVREVAALPPESSLDLPLVDGWEFSQGGADSGRRWTYRLLRIDGSGAARHQQ